MSKFTESNPYIKQEFAEYLQANGYQEFFGSSIQYSASLFKDDLLVAFVNDRLDILTLTEEEPGERSATFSKWFSFTGFSQLDTFGFMLLMHITRVVPLKKFLAEVKKDSANPLPDLINQLLHQFNFTNGKEVVESY